MDAPILIHTGTAIYKNLQFVIRAEWSIEAEDLIHESDLGVYQILSSERSPVPGFWVVTVRVFEVTDGDPS